MKTVEIRNRFLEYFSSQDHDVQASAPLVNKNDPTLMFINAGMNQFKDIFLGNEQAKFPRVANSQKCLRVSGKHNDLEEVGVDTYHHTLFEMLGNWSFGDYFKEKAIEMAWRFITEELKIDKNNLYVTYFEGDDQDALAPDDETKEIWSRYLASDRILTGNKKDNFWEMGDVGPCGPCTEIHVDLRSQSEKDQKPGAELVNQDHPQVIEIWNLVFIAFNRFTDGKLKPLPNKHVDTGMGLERLAMVMQGKTSTYDTDIFAQLIAHLSGLCGKKYTGGDSKQDVAFRVISDHIRAVAFAIADGQLPSNTGAGYVIRRILRRAVRYAYSFLDFSEPFFYSLVPILVKEMGAYFPEISNQQEFVVKVIREEELAFFRTLSSGLQKINQYIGQAESGVLSGEKAFELYDTYGFPFDLTALILSERGWSTSEKEFEACMAQQKARSKKAAEQETGDWVEVRSDQEIEFVGYDNLECQSNVVKHREVKTKKDTLYHIVLDKTPFYPEGGGQVGDAGILLGETESIPVISTKRENNLIIHITKKAPSEKSYMAKVDREKRLSTQRNHSATHLLHLVLRDLLGNHVEQRGSLVNADYLRFDFSHFEKVSEEQLQEVEQRVNNLIFSSIPLAEHRAITKEQAEAMGAMALFGEKYGDVVRAIKFGDSVELCGGTHVNNTSEIGFVKLISESSVAAGVRRIEMVSGRGAIQYTNTKLNTLSEIESKLKSVKDPVKDVEKLLDSKSKLEKKLEGLEKAQLQTLKSELKANAKELGNGIYLIAYKGDIDGNGLKNLAFELKDIDNTVVALAAENEGKVLLQIGVNKSLTEKGVSAKALIKETASLIKGGGGGQDFLASAGGKNPAGITEALNKIEGILERI
ncbi:alanine--tRNA ligase [Luteibaculum oceani]|uniref:Alanine--tRNA ligase n=1 Tax=Luteibaculum oceani TaxID=1294296 RepID=A0A5C6V4J5_9FLAO|nr:alanine--tRNA ligase [Luteibaculum oceani]TXC78395.1 alanine--tRNA ligase [Luteibaculum oceani]